EQGRLAAARRPDERQDLACLDREVDALERTDLAVGMADRLNEKVHGHALSLAASLEQVEMTLDEAEVEEALGVDGAIEQALRLIPGDLAIDVAHQEPALRIDEGDALGDLLGRLVDVFGDEDECRGALGAARDLAA